MNLHQFSPHSLQYFVKHYAKQYVVKQSLLPLQVRASKLMNLFRLILSLALLFAFLYLDKEHWWDAKNSLLFYNLALSYAIFSVGVLIVNTATKSALPVLHPVQIIIDIGFVILLMYAAGGIQSGLGLLLIITIVTASLVSIGRLAFFYAAIATIGLLLEQSYQIVKWDLSAASYTQPVMLSITCFATAWLAFSYAKRMQHSEALASARGVDLENLAQVNALITQEMQDGVIVVDQNSIIRHHNLRAESLLALTKQNIDNLSLMQTLPKIGYIFYDWLNGKETKHNSIVSINNHELKLTLMPINQLRSAGAVIFIQDWSQIQSAAQQAKLAALGRLTANIAHEIRNPLSAISHATQLLQEDDISATHARILQIITDNIGRIDKIIKDVLELNRRDRTHTDTIVLTQFLTDFHTQFCMIEKIPVAQFPLSVNLKESKTAVKIQFDQRHLTQILWNLCKNGWEHSQQITAKQIVAKQSVRLQLNVIETADSTLNIEITDNGLGVAEQDRARLFEPFFTTKTTGNGLGLYISRELTEANGASLHYHMNNTDFTGTNVKKYGRKKPQQNNSTFVLKIKKLHS